MLEQTVVKYNAERERVVRKVLRVIQFVLLAIAMTIEGMMFSLFFALGAAGEHWLGAVVYMVLFAMPAIGVLLLLEWRIRKLDVQYDYYLTDKEFVVWRIIGNSRKPWINMQLDQVMFCKRYRDLDEEEKKRVRPAIFAACNEEDPMLTLVEADMITIGKRSRPAGLLLELNNEIFTRIRRSAGQNRFLR